MTPWTNPISYTPRPVTSKALDANAKIVDDMLAMLGDPIKDEPMSRSSKLLLLGIAFVIGCMMGLA